MNDFITRHASKVTGVLQGFDRLLFRGHLTRLNYAEGVAGFLRRQGALLKDFGKFVEHVTSGLREDAANLASAIGRPAVYLQSSAVRKEDVARRLLGEHPIDAGLVCILSCVEPCTTWQVFRSRKAQTQELRRRPAKCLHHYFYFLDPTFGWMHVRVQTWMPYTVQICLNGREWLAKQLDAEGIGYRRAGNCFLDLDDVDGAQQIMDGLVNAPWQSTLDRFVSTANPVLDVIAEHALDGYRWGLHQCEFATDVMLKRADNLAALYPPTCPVCDHRPRQQGRKAVPRQAIDHDVPRRGRHHLQTSTRGDLRSARRGWELDQDVRQARLRATDRDDDQPARRTQSPTPCRGGLQQHPQNEAYAKTYR